MHLAIQECQILSKALAIQNCQIASNDIAIRERQITSNQDDTCPHHLAVLWCHADVIKPKAKGYMLNTILHLGMEQANVGHKVMPSTFLKVIFCTNFYIRWSRDITRRATAHNKLPQTRQPWWWSRSPLQRQGFDQSTRSIVRVTQERGWLRGPVEEIRQ